MAAALASRMREYARRGNSRKCPESSSIRNLRSPREREMPALTHLERLEAESIDIMREAVAESERPVMLYSIGKDSSVMLHLAMKAFYPAKLPFALLHVDTTWKFREMIAFRDETARRLGVKLIVHINQDGIARGINPFVSGSQLYTHVMKTEALNRRSPATASTRRSAAPGAMRRKAARRSESSRSAHKHR